MSLYNTENTVISVDLQKGTNCYVAFKYLNLDDYCLQGEQGDDGKVEGPPGPQGDIVSCAELSLHQLPCGAL